MKVAAYMDPKNNEINKNGIPNDILKFLASIAKSIENCCQKN